MNMKWLSSSLREPPSGFVPLVAGEFAVEPVVGWVAGWVAKTVAGWAVDSNLRPLLFSWMGV
jgi:hypothetical protein